ncbi:MAG: phenylalanine--tRNA ligase subunit beta, partial [Acetanaerobacterium sp.]
MNLSMRWLREYVDIDAAPRAFAESMTMSGSKVEGYDIEGEEIANVVVGRVLSIVRHPDADKLVVCQVDAAQDAPIQIVTGATNVVEGALVPVALNGSTLPGGVKIKKGKLRGMESNGMMCSLTELGLTVNDFPYAIEDGIFLLEEDCRIGQDIREAIGLNDISVEFEITSNRPDCLSMIGLAREAAVTFKKSLSLHTPVVKGAGGDVGSLLSVKVENKAFCPRYSARVVKNVKIAPSPRWLRERLRACGVRPINNLVDITNYVMLEYGQPMHAFDQRYVAGQQIIVRNAAPGETITTLDGSERTLSPEMLVICDSEKPVAVAGVMGGEYSGIMDDTNTVVFESAVFDGVSVRTTAKKLGMRTEASSRFEKGLDPANTLPALERACELVELLGAGEVVSGLVDVDNSDKTPRTIALEPDWINRFI